MSKVKLNKPQLDAINSYRKSNNISSNTSNDEVIKQMIKKGKLPACLASLASTPKTSNNKTSNTSIWGDKKPTAQQELQMLGLKNHNGANKEINIKGKTYTIVGEASNGRRIVKDSNGEFQVISHDNGLLKKSYVIDSNKKAIEKKTSTNFSEKSY